MADEGAIIKVVGVGSNKIVPNKLAQAQHARTEAYQLTHSLIQQGTAGCRPACTCQQGMLIGPVHADEAKEREDDDARLHIDVETRKVEKIDKVDILYSKLYLGIFVHLVQLLLTQLDLLRYIIQNLHGLLLYQILNCVMR
jgi:ubiquitin